MNEGCGSLRGELVLADREVVFAFGLEREVNTGEGRRDSTHVVEHASACRVKRVRSRPRVGQEGRLLDFPFSILCEPLKPRTSFVVHLDPHRIQLEPDLSVAALLRAKSTAIRRRTPRSTLATHRDRDTGSSLLPVNPSVRLLAILGGKGMNDANDGRRYGVDTKSMAVWALEGKDRLAGARARLESKASWNVDSRHPSSCGGRWVESREDVSKRDRAGAGPAELSPYARRG